MTIAPSPSRASDPLGAGPLDAGESLGAPGTLGSNSASAQDSAAGMTRRRFFEVLLASSSLLAVGSMAFNLARFSILMILSKFANLSRTLHTLR